MRRYNSIFVWLIVLTLTLFSIPAFSQDIQAPAAEAPEEAGPATEKITQPEELSIYGEVQSINKDSNSISVQYYDYDSDEEKVVEIALDKDTKLENVAASSDIKQNDWVDLTYSVSGGKNIAKSIIVEKEEEFSVEAPEEQ